MIEVIRHDGGISVKGHAHYAEPGKDIVCAAVSILVQNLIQSIEELTPDKIEYEIQPGWVCIKHGNLSEKAKSLVDSFFIGICLVADEFRGYIRIL